MAVAIWMFLQVILMLFRTGYVIGERKYLYRNVISLRLLGDEPASSFQMCRIRAVNAGSIFRADVHSLFVDAVRVDDLEEIRNEGIDAYDSGVECGFHALSISIIGAIERIGATVRASRFGGYHPR